MKSKTRLQPNGFLLLLPAGPAPSLFKAIAAPLGPAGSASAAVMGKDTHRAGGGGVPLLRRFFFFLKLDNRYLGHHCITL